MCLLLWFSFFKLVSRLNICILILIWKFKKYLLFKKKNQFLHQLPNSHFHISTKCLQWAFFENLQRTIYIENYYLISMTVILQLLMQSAFHHTFFPESVKNVTGSHPQAGRTIASVDLHQAFAKSSEIFLVLLNICYFTILAQCSHHSRSV